MQLRPLSWPLTLGLLLTTKTRGATVACLHLPAEQRALPAVPGPGASSCEQVAPASQPHLELNARTGRTKGAADPGLAIARTGQEVGHFCHWLHHSVWQIHPAAQERFPGMRSWATSPTGGGLGLS